MDIFLLYLFTRLDAFIFLLLFGAGMGGVVVLACAIGLDDTWDHLKPERKTALRAWRTRGIVIASVFLLFAALVPTQKDAALILAGSAVIDVAKSETAGRLASKSVQLIEQTLDGYLKPKEAK